MEARHRCSSRWGAVTGAVVLGVLGALSSGPTEAGRGNPPAPIPEKVPPRPENHTRCQYQEPQDFLMRSSFVRKGRLAPEELRRREEAHQRAIAYRTKNYGYFPGFGQKAWNAHPPSFYAVTVPFAGKKVRLNRRIAPLLGCVEEQIRQECAATPYQPQALSGLRTRNTYHTGEVSNHVYGIALDVDPLRNTCCACVRPWSDHASCKRPVSSIYERMAMPECWVHVFERFGFYWLGRDELQDTMHFEFLGDPERILREGEGKRGAPSGA